MLKNGYVLDEVLKTICKDVGKEWRKLLQELRCVVPDITDEYLGELENNGQTAAEKMKDCFEFLEKQNVRIQWRDLSNALDIIKREDIRKKILRTSLVTQGTCQLKVSTRKLLVV